MRTNQEITHEGIIKHIQGNHILVRIMQTSACAGCKIANSCHADYSPEGKEKMIDVYSAADGFYVGQTVTVSTTAAMARKALMMGFVFPLVMLLATLLLLLAMGQTELVAALAAIAVLIPYYIYIWIQRHRLATRLTFSIRPI